MPTYLLFLLKTQMLEITIALKSQFSCGETSYKTACFLLVPLEWDVKFWMTIGLINQHNGARGSASFDLASSGVCESGLYVLLSNGCAFKPCCSLLTNGGRC